MHLKVEVPLFIALMVTWVSGQDCGDSKLTENHGKFTSPNYPNRYDHRADCKWIITAPPDHFIEVEFKEFDVKNPFWVCDYDYVTVIYGGGRANDTFCNDNKPKPIRSVTNTLTIHLKSDHFYSNGVGFEAEYYIVDKDGQKVAGEEDYNDDDDDWEDESTESPTTTSSTTSSTTTTTTTSTKAPATTTTSTTTTSTTTTTTSTLIAKLTSSIAAEMTTSSNNNDGNNAGKMSGFVITAIIGAVLLVFGIILFIAFVRYRRNKNKRIDLSVIEVADGKELISEDKIYKKQGKKIVRVPEAETFPL